ncbi:rhodanese-like domain-containing protein [Ilumatobacter sp.]|uniref:rhodanese-like domain-containing protein n=1 Tax=Ilumatobacter sp. TaxID=1967498 RepID=UPI003C53DACC
MKSVEEMVAEARRTITGYSPEEARRRVEEEGALLVDIRDVRELERDGVVPGAHHAPRGMLEFWVDPQSPYHKPVFAEDREFIFYCAVGSRSSLTVKTLDEMGLERAAHVETGFTGWKGDGLPVATMEEWKATRR